jgi:hypothetical protein
MITLFILEMLSDLSGVQFNFDCVSDMDIGMWESDSPAVVGDDVGHFIWAHSF